jgi:hypothetical protein
MGTKGFLLEQCGRGVKVTIYLQLVPRSRISELLIRFPVRIHGLVTPSQDRLCGIVVRVPGYTTEMYCASCEARTEYIYI